jgi:dephospho-CoA kinase
MLRIGLTGGIASGKTTVAGLFADKGATVIDTDRIARDVVEPGMPALAALVNALGGGILGDDGRLDRAGLRRRLFADATTRRTVESILHPAILAELDREAARAPGPYQVLVVPLLADGRHESLVNRVLVVDCTEETQIRRLMERDGETHTSAIRMLASQISRERRLAAADDIIENDGPTADLEPRVAVLDRKYRELATKH